MIPLQMNDKMIKTLALLAVTALLFSCQESLLERAAREAREMTETKCPMPVGDNLMLDSVVFDIPTLTQSQYFRVLGSLDDEELFEDVDAKALLLEELRNTPSYRALMERDVAFRYIYRSSESEDKVLLDLTLMPEDYK